MHYYIIGYGGFAKEVELYVKDNDKSNKVTFVVENKNRLCNLSNVIQENDFLSINQKVFCLIAIGNNKIRKKIFNKLNKRKNIVFCNFIHKSVCYDSLNLELGIGNIICPNCILTSNIKIKNFTHINLNTTVGHDTKIGSFVTISPGTNISGNVIIKNNCFLGTNSSIIEKIKLKKNTVLGAGSVLLKNVEESGTYVGIPAKIVKKNTL